MPPLTLPIKYYDIFMNKKKTIEERKQKYHFKEMDIAGMPHIKASFAPATAPEWKLNKRKMISIVGPKRWKT